MNYEIYSYGNVDALSGLFNALAALMGGSAFMQSIEIVFVVGFFGAFMASALAPDRLIGLKWLATVILVYLLLFLPKATVQVVDKVGGQPPAVIANVPLGLAFQAGLTSSVGNTLTELFETALQVLPGTAGLPADLAYTNHGLVFGAQVVTATQGSGFSDVVFKSNIVNFLQNCTFYDISQGFIPAGAFSTSSDIWPMLGTTNPARFSTYTDPVTGAVSALACPTVYTNLDGIMNTTAVPSLMQQIGLKLNPWLQLPGNKTLPGFQAAQVVDPQIAAAYQRFNIADVSTASANIIRQNAMIDAIHAANLLSSQSSNDPSATMLGLATAQATIQMNTQQIASGQIASQALPLVRNAIEAVIYGLFPFVLLLAMLLGGVQAYQLLKGYGLALIWIALWPPIYAIINYLDTLAIAKNAAADAYNTVTGAQGLTLSTSNAIYGGMISDMAVVGYLVMSVPAIAGALVFGLSKMTQIAAGFTGMAGQKAAGSASMASASGNVSMGNASFEQQQLSPARNDAFMRSFSDLKGTETTDMRSGDIRYQQNIGDDVVGLKSTSEWATSLSESSARKHALAEDQSRQAEQATTVALDSALSNITSHGTGTQGSTGIAGRHDTGTESSIANLAAIRDQLAKDLRITDTSRATSVLTLSLGAGNDKSEGNTAKDMDTGTISRIGKMVRAGLGVSGQQVTDNQIAAAVAHARQSARDMQVQDVHKVMDGYTRSEDFKTLSKTSKDQTDQIRSSMGRSEALRESASRNFRESEEYSQSAQKMKSAALRGELNWIPEYHNFLKQKSERDHANYLGATGGEAMELLNEYVQQGGVGVGADGSPKFMLYDGSTPTRDPVAPESFADSGKLQHGVNEGALSAEGKSITRKSLARENTSNNARINGRGTGALVTAPANGDQLQAAYDKQRGQNQAEVEQGRGETATSRADHQQALIDANDHTSIFHNLGDQPDGRSAKQQADSELKKPDN